MPRKSNITNDNIQLIINDYNNGMFCKDISKKYHIDFTKLKKKLISQGKIVDREVELSYEQLIQISNRYKNGEQLKYLAKEYNIGIAKLTARLKSNNLYYKKYEFVSQEELNMYIDEYQNSYTPKEISILHNRSDTTIINALKNAGVYVEKTARWTDEEIEILRKYYTIEPIGKIIERLPNHSNEQTIFAKASSLGIPGYGSWLDNELKILKENYGIISVEKIYELLNERHTIGSIRCKAQRLGFGSDPFWTEEDEKALIENYPVKDFDEVRKLFPNRTEIAIRNHAKTIGIKSKQYLNEKYSKEQIKFICDNWLKMNDTQMAKILNKSPAGIMAQRNKLGLYKIKKDYSNYPSLDKFFRGHIQQWKNDSMESCEYKCVFTGSKNFAIHHIYGFNNILKEVYEILDNQNLLKSTKIEDYTKEELDEFLSVFNDIHSSYPLGVCIRKDIHDLFHKIYGSGGNTKEQWEQFCEDFNNGLYNKEIA